MKYLRKMNFEYDTNSVNFLYTGMNVFERKTKFYNFILKCDK